MPPRVGTRLPNKIQFMITLLSISGTNGDGSGINGDGSPFVSSFKVASAFNTVVYRLKPQGFDSALESKWVIVNSSDTESFFLKFKAVAYLRLNPLVRAYEKPADLFAIY